MSRWGTALREVRERVTGGDGREPAPKERAFVTERGGDRPAGTLARPASEEGEARTPEQERDQERRDRFNRLATSLNDVRATAGRAVWATTDPTLKAEATGRYRACDHLYSYQDAINGHSRFENDPDPLRDLIHRAVEEFNHAEKRVRSRTDSEPQAFRNAYLQTIGAFLVKAGVSREDGGMTKEDIADRYRSAMRDTA